jgi:hypothetical protein
LQGLFAQYYQYGGQYIGLLKTGFQNEGTSIKNSLATLNKPPLQPALNAPNSAYNQFISTWNNGNGDLTRSFRQIDQFWTLLQAAKPELDVLMVPAGPGPAPSGKPPLTPPELAVFTTLRTQTNQLGEVFKSCVANHTPAAASKIKEHVRVIGEQINSSSLGQQARMALTKPNAEWQQFTSRYKNGAVIDMPTYSLLEYFVISTNIACAKFLR